MNNNNDSSSSALEAERDRLRKQCSALWDEKRAIEMQMEEINIRLQWLDDKIDGTGIDAGDCALTMPTSQTQTQHDESDIKVKFEEEEDAANEKKMGEKKKRLRAGSDTQPEEYLTDPHTQQQQLGEEEEYLSDPIQDDDENEKGGMGVHHNNTKIASSTTDQENNVRRISSSPPSSEMNNGGVVGGGGEKTRPSSNNNSNNNPFGDLWDLNEESLTNHIQSAQTTNNNMRKGVNSSTNVNTLEKYFVNNNAAVAASAQPGRTTAPPSNNPYNTNTSTASRGQNNPYIMNSNSINNRRSINETSVASQNNNNSTRYPWTDRMKYHLQHTFSIAKFRGHQEEIINATMQGQDAFVVMRTGGGKSLTYQLPSVIEVERQQPRKVTIVISPLVSLIRDQEMQMNQMRPGSAVSFTSGMAGGTSEHARRWNLVRDPNGGVGLIFVTPEKVSKSHKFKGEMEKLQSQGRLARFVVDECHCACQWGHDFRPDYTKLGVLKHHFPTVPVLAVTATASDRVRHDVAQILRLGNNYRFFRSTANRPNLNYSVRCKPDSKEAVVKDMVAFIQENHAGEAGIVYTFSKKEADTVASSLRANGISAQSYHSDVRENKKDQIQNSWMRNKTQVVVATIAFGLGINKHDCRFVLHHSLSKSLEAYYQESGRAGRDGGPANCVLYYSPKDVPRMLGMIHGEAGETSFWSMAKYGQAHGDDALCRHTILATLGETNETMPAKLLNLKNNCKTTTRRQLGVHCQTLVKVVHQMSLNGEDGTINQVVAKWRSKDADGNFSFLKDNSPSKDLNKEECERVVIALLVEDILHPNIVYTAYNTIVYLRLGPRGQACMNSRNISVEIDLPVRTNKKAAASSKTSLALAETDENGWISTKPQANKTKSKKRTSKTAGKTKAAKAKKPKTKKKTSSKRKSAKSKMPTIVDIVEIDSSSSSESDDEMVLAKRASRNKKQKVIYEETSDDDSEFELSD